MFIERGIEHGKAPASSETTPLPYGIHRRGRASDPDRLRPHKTLGVFRGDSEKQLEILAVAERVLQGR